MPTSVLPVKVSFLTRASAKNTSDTAAGSEVVSTWNTSAGPPACTHNSTRRVAIAAGKFHGVTAYTGPTGCRIANRRLLAAWLGTISPYARLASSAYHST